MKNTIRYCVAYQKYHDEDRPQHYTTEKSVDMPTDAQIAVSASGKNTIQKQRKK